jgi:2'-5' RNA ligase
VTLEYHEGQTVILAPVPEAETAVRRWRDEFDRTAAEGIPAHIGILFPFVDRERIDDQVLADAADVVSRHPPIQVLLAEVKRFPDGNIYLEPEPDGPFRELTEAVWKRWPDHPPYEGRYGEVIPHLTVAIAPPRRRASEIESSLRAALPIAARVLAVELWTYEPGRWRKLAAFELGGSAPHASLR